jgi:hypothetical protein
VITKNEFQYPRIFREKIRKLSKNKWYNVVSMTGFTIYGDEILNPSNSHERTTTAKNMGILKYHLTSLISYERCWPPGIICLACLEDLIKPNQASHQSAR